MAASGAMPSWTNNASVPHRVIAHPRGVQEFHTIINTSTNTIQMQTKIQIRIKRKTKCNNKQGQKFVLSDAIAVQFQGL